MSRGRRYVERWLLVVEGARAGAELLDWLAENPSSPCSVDCCTKGSRMHETTQANAGQWYSGASQVSMFLMDVSGGPRSCATASAICFMLDWARARPCFRLPAFVGEWLSRIQYFVLRATRVRAFACAVQIDRAAAVLPRTLASLRARVLLLPYLPGFCIIPWR